MRFLKKEDGDMGMKNVNEDDGLYWALLGSTRLYWTVLDCTGL